MVIADQPVAQDTCSFGRIGRGVVRGMAALAGGLVLEQPGDLGEREAGVVAQALDEAEPLQIRVVVEAIVALGAGRGREKPQLLVVAHGARRQSDFGSRLMNAKQSDWVVDGLPRFQPWLHHTATLPFTRTYRTGAGRLVASWWRTEREPFDVTVARASVRVTGERVRCWLDLDEIGVELEPGHAGGLLGSGAPVRGRDGSSKAAM